MSWIQTYTGKQFFPLEARSADIDIADIAHALSLQCRFNGHCRCFYSVAEHSVRVSRAVPASHARWGLLHDAGEAYLSDLPRPIKLELPAFSAFEGRLLEVVAERFGLPWPMPPEVLDADNRLLVTEARDLMGPPPASWGMERIAPYVEPIEPWSPPTAEQRFLDRFGELFFKRQAAER